MPGKILLLNLSWIVAKTEQSAPVCNMCGAGGKLPASFFGGQVAQGVCLGRVETLATPP